LVVVSNTRRRADIERELLAAMGLSELLAPAASDGHTGLGPYQLQTRPDGSHKLGQIVDKH